VRVKRGRRARGGTKGISDNCTQKLLYQKNMGPSSGISWRAGRGGEVAADTIHQEASPKSKDGLAGGLGQA